jgi:hypothetical protein
LKWIPAFGLFLILYFIFAFFIFDLNFTTIAFTDNNSATEFAAKNALQKSINKGVLRLEGKVTVNEKVAKDELVKFYAANINAYTGNKLISIKEIQNDPPMIVVDSFSGAESLYKKYQDEESWENDFNLTRSREIFIYEAKELN